MPPLLLWNWFSLDMTASKMTIDAKDQMLGRLASRAAAVLIGKNSPAFLKHIKEDHRVEIINAAKVKVSGSKMKDKQYTRYSGYHSGLHKRSMGKEFARSPSYVIRKTIWGMLPKNKLRKRIIKNLTITD